MSPRPTSITIIAVILLVLGVLGAIGNVSSVIVFWWNPAAIHRVESGPLPLPV